MTTDRPYQRALTLQEALGEIRRGRGTQFAPEVVDAFLATFGAGAVLSVVDGGKDEPLRAAG